MAQVFKTATNFELNQSENFVLESLASLPGGEALVLGRVFIFTDSDGLITPFYYDGTRLLPFRGLKATNVTDGLMSAADKAKLDAIQGNGVGSGGISQSSSQGYQRAFSQADLTSGGFLLVNHGLNGYPSGITVYNGSGRVISPNSIDLLNLNTISIDFADFIPLQGNYRIALLAVITPAINVQYFAESISLREGGVSEGSPFLSPSSPVVTYVRQADGIILCEGRTLKGTFSQNITYQRYFDGIILREAGADKNIMTADVLFFINTPSATKVTDGSRLRSVIGDSAQTFVSGLTPRYSGGSTLIGCASDAVFTVTSGINPALIVAFI